MTAKATYTAGTTLPELFESINPELSLLTRFESSLLTYLGFPNRLGKVTNPRHEWQEEALEAIAATVSGAQADNDTSLEVATGQGARFSAGDIIQVDGSRELMSVTSIASDTLTVVRGIRGSTAVSILDGATVSIVGNPRVENAGAATARPNNRVRKENYTEIFEDAAEVTRSMMLSNVIGVDDEMSEQLMIVRARLVRSLAKTVWVGRVQSANPQGTNSQARSMNGIIPLILAGSDPSVIAAANAPVSEDMLNSLMQDMWTKGGRPVALVGGPTQIAAISKLLEGRQRFTETTSVLGAVVKRFVGPFGSIDLLEPDIHAPSDVLAVIDPARIKLAKLGTQGGDPFEERVQPRAGLVDKTQVVGEFTLEMHNAGDGGHGLITGLPFAA